MPLSLDRHRRQRRLHLPRLQTDGGKTKLRQARTQPFRHRPSLKPNLRNPIPPGLETLRDGGRLRRHARLLQDLTFSVDDADGYRVQRDIKANVHHRDLPALGQAPIVLFAAERRKRLKRSGPNTPSLP